VLYVLYSQGGVVNTLYYLTPRIAEAVLSLFVVFLVVGCAPATKENVTMQADWHQSLSGTGKSIVTGRIEWIENGEHKKNEEMFGGFRLITPHLLRLEDKARIIVELDENGRFVWQLSPGTYVINRINYRDSWSGNYFFVPKTAFKIDQPGLAYYVGTLHAEFSKERDLIGGVSGVVRFEIRDEYQKAEIHHKTGFKSIEVRKALMVRNETLPSTIDTTEEFNLSIQILNAIFMGM
jgi:hypothetical protein